MFKYENIKKWEKHLDFFKNSNENFNNKTIPTMVKELSRLIRIDILNDKNYKKKLYNIGDVNIIIELNFIKYNKPYYSNINIFEILNGSKNIPLIIELEKNYDIDYLIGIISHEIRHIYDIYSIADETEIEDFKKSLYINSLKINNKPFIEFLDLIYLSLEHELVAYNNMLYGSYRWLDIRDKNELKNLIKKSYTYTSLKKLKNFNHKEFINKHNINNLMSFTVDFSKSFNDEFNDLETYYKKWENYFSFKADEYLNQINLVIDEIISEKNINEYKSIKYEFGTEVFKMNFCTELFNKMIIEKNKL